MHDVLDMYDKLHPVRQDSYDASGAIPFCSESATMHVNRRVFLALMLGKARR